MTLAVLGGCGWGVGVGAGRGVRGETESARHVCGGDGCGLVGVLGGRLD